MKWIGQHIYDLTSRFRSGVYLEDVSTGTIASGGNLGLDSNNKIVKATISSGSGDITGVTITTDSGGGSAASDTAGSADFSILGSHGVGVTNSGTTITAVAIAGEIDHDSLSNFVANEHIDWTGASAGTIHASNYTDTNTNELTEFTLTGDSGSNQTIGHGSTLDIAGGNAISTVVGATDTVTINHDDTSSQASVNNSGRTFIQDITLDTYGHVTAITSATDADTHEGDITEITITTDSGGGSAASVDTGAAEFTIVGTSGVGVTNADLEITVTSVPGEIDHDSLLNFAANEHFTQANITTVGTIGTGVWQGTAVATDQQKHLAYFEFKGYGTGDGTNYEMPEQFTDANAPFEHDTSTGSNGLTAQTIQTVMRSGGVVMPYTGFLKKFQGWATSAGSGSVHVALFKFTPTDDTAGNLTPAQLVNESITASGNAIMNSFSETSSFDVGFDAGDIIKLFSLIVL